MINSLNAKSPIETGKRTVRTNRRAHEVVRCQILRGPVYFTGNEHGKEKTLAQAIRNSDVAVVGGGPAGLTATCLLAQIGLDVLCVDPAAASNSDDARTTALMQGSIKLLENIGVWDDLRPHSAPLQVMKMIDDTGRVFKAPTVAFDAAEVGPEPFGWNIPNSVLADTLRSHASDLGATIAAGSASGISPTEDAVQFKVTGDRKSEARMVLGADGRNSPSRRAAGISVNRWDYPQTAVVTTFDHSGSHENTSIEFHRRAGPLTVVPLPGSRSSLVWIETPETAADLASLDDQAFARALERETRSMLGRISGCTPRRTFPISGLTARSFAARRIMLIGEAAHVIPPIGAQGLNLGFRDAALACELIADARDEGADIGGERVLDAYDRKRRRDILPRTVAVDLLNRSLFQDFLPFQGARNIGLRLMESFGPLRRQLMKQGIGPTEELPRLMR